MESYFAEKLKAKKKKSAKNYMRKRKLAMWKLCTKNKVEVSGRKGGGVKGGNLP